MTNTITMHPTLNASILARRKLFAAVALAVATLSGCAFLAPATPEAEVTARAQQRWKALIASDWSAAHAFLTPAFRTTMPVERYRERFVGVPRWKKVTVQSARCESEKCTVVVRIEAEYGARTGLETLSTEMPETWLKESGQWYFYEAM